MNAPLDLSDDFPLLADLTEAVTLRRAGSGETQSIPHALRRGVQQRDAAASGGRLRASDVRWHLAAAELSEPPALGDTIIDAAGTHWVVLEARLEAAGSRWRCVARNLAIVHGLAQRITIERAVWSKDTAGAARPAWHARHAGVRAHIQPHTARVSTAQGRVGIETTHRVLLTEPLTVDQDDRVVGPDGRIYRILGYTPAQQLGEPQVLDVVESGTLEQESS